MESVPAPAERLNRTLARERPQILNMLSKGGIRMYFPKAGILAQSAEAKLRGKLFNCSIGIATEGGVPMHVDCVKKHFNSDLLTPAEIFPYAPPAGLVSLRKAWQLKQHAENPNLGDTSLPIVTAALTHGLSVLGDLFVDPGDEVMMPDQFWGNYKLIFEVSHGANIVTFPLFDERLIGIDVGAFKKAIFERVEKKQKKLVIILNFPNNPTGYAPTKTEMRAIVQVLKDAAEAGLKLVVIADDAYYGMFYSDNVERSSVFSFLAQAHENILACRVDGGTKEAFMWGFRVGFLTFGSKGVTPKVYGVLEDKAVGAVRACVSSVSLPGQSILEKALSSKEFKSEQEQKVELLRDRALEVKRVVQQPRFRQAWDVYPFNSGYFMLLRVKGVNAHELRKHLLDIYQVGLISTSSTDIRVAFSCLEKVQIEKVFETIALGIKDLRHEYLISDLDQTKLDNLDNEQLVMAIRSAIFLCKPAEVLVFNDSPDEIAAVRKMARVAGEERPLEMEGHTIHFDNFHDQARDKANTKVLLNKGEKLSQGLNYGERYSHLREILSKPGRFLNGAMKGKRMYVRFFCLGPAKSRFALCALQITDSAYVAHSEDILYRVGYEQFRLLAQEDRRNEFFTFIHSAGKLDERGCTSDEVIHDRRIYIDPYMNHVYSVNNQYAGNSLACKKLALRLAIYKANNEGWLTEHMFLSGFKPILGPQAGKRITYFTGAYPSACGKTSTAMIPGSTIVGDDIVYLREGKEGEMRAVNIEQGMFGIIKDVNAADDPLIFHGITTPKEIIFSNVLVHDDKVYWTGMGQQIPKEGANHSGEWHEGTMDGKELVPCSHPNSRFTLRLEELENCDVKALHDPEGVPVDAILYGGRDNDTSVPVAESRSWVHGVFMGASILSKTTSATLGKAGAVTFNPMANMDFVIVPLGKYISNHLTFGRKLRRPPRVYATNYFLQRSKVDKTTGEPITNGDGLPVKEFLNTKLDKTVWVLWAEGRIHNEFGCIATPVGNIPLYEDLKILFATQFKGKANEKYTKEMYNEQFSIRCDLYLNDKLAIVEKKYHAEESEFPDSIPQEFWDVLTLQKKELSELRGKVNGPVATPDQVRVLYPQ